MRLPHFFALGVLALAPIAWGAETLYVATGSSGTLAKLYTYSVNGGTVTQVGNALDVLVGGTDAVCITGLAVHPSTGVLYAVTTNQSPNNPNSLLTIDPVTGTATTLGAMGEAADPGARVADITFSPTGVLYGWAGLLLNLRTIDTTTATPTDIGSSPDNGITSTIGGGLAFTPSGSVLYLATAGDGGPLFTIDPVTGTATALPLVNGHMNGPGNPINAMGCNSTGILYASVGPNGGGGPRSLKTIDTTTGDLTTLISLPANTDALAFATSFAMWQSAKFTASELTDSSKSGANAVFGVDGLSNLVKYALGLEPKTNITTGLPALTTDASNWIYTYTRPSNRPDITYSVEFSTNLSTWTTTGVTHTRQSTTNYVETWTATYPLASATNAFFRLTITQI